MAALDRAPDDPMIGGRTCWALAIAGQDLERALALADWAIQTWPTDLNYLDAKGIIRDRGFVEDVGKRVDELLKEMELPEAPKPAAPGGKP